MELFIVARFHARAGQESAVEAALREVSGPSRAEPGCLGFQVFRSTRDSRLFYIHSRWMDEAAFDFHAGLKRQAPLWMQRNGLEWLFRLGTEPRRLWRRYLKNNPLFLWGALLQLSGIVQYDIEPPDRARLAP